AGPACGPCGARHVVGLRPWRTSGAGSSLGQAGAIQPPHQRRLAAMTGTQLSDASRHPLDRRGSLRQVAEVFEQLDRSVVLLGLSGRDGGLDLPPEFVFAPAQAIQVAGAGGGLLAGTPGLLPRGLLCRPTPLLLGQAVPLPDQGAGRSSRLGSDLNPAGPYPSAGLVFPEMPEQLTAQRDAL